MTQFTLARTRVAPPSDDALYDQVAGAAAGLVIRNYSSSFGLSSRLLHQPVRDHIRNIYALVRLADEVVDGPMALERPRRAGDLLDRLEAETVETLSEGYSTNLVVHAFTGTARACGISRELITPFFASMRTDLSVRDHDAASFEQYVYGSAEVVGLMCLRVFVSSWRRDEGRPVEQEHERYAELAAGARRLGSAFQKVNFLRDLGADYQGRHRCYFPGIDPTDLSERDKHLLLDDIDADLDVAAATIPGLPDNSRSAVTVAHAVFDELSSRLRQAPAAALMQRRVRVPSAVKARIALTALVHERVR